MKQAADLMQRAQRVKMILMDADGVLTDGKIVFFSGGNEAKMFDSKDGVGHQARPAGRPQDRRHLGA